MLREQLQELTNSLHKQLLIPSSHLTQHPYDSQKSSKNFPAGSSSRLDYLSTKPHAVALLLAELQRLQKKEYAQTSVISFLRDQVYFQRNLLTLCTFNQLIVD